MLSKNNNNENSVGVINYTIRELLGMGAHLGHSIANTFFLSSWMVFRIVPSEDMVILNIFRLFLQVRVVMLFLQKLVVSRLPIWFVTTQPMLMGCFSKWALNCAEFFNYMYWVPGVITNFFTVYGYLYRNKHLIENLYVPFSGKYSLYLLIWRSLWLYSRRRTPSTIFLANALNEEIVRREALQAGIPVIGLADNETGTTGISFLLVSNDDSFSTIYYFICLFAKVILSKKYGLFLRWNFSIYKLSRKRHLVDLTIKALLRFGTSNNLNFKKAIKSMMIRNRLNYINEDFYPINTKFAFWRYIEDRRHDIG